MAYSNTLIIRHLPMSLTKNEIEDLLDHVGATKVVVYESKVKKHVAFAKFKTAEVAREALFRLHQKEILGNRLVVEFSKSIESHDLDPVEGNTKEQKSSKELKKTQLYETFLRNLNSWTIGLNFTLPPPHHLRYRYPPPSAEVLLNIVNMLSSKTKFYTQVLHLMNKMNLPSPFEASFPLQENDIFNSFMIYILENSVYERENYDQKEENHLSSNSENESELESEVEENKCKINPIIPNKRSHSERKLIKRRKLLKPMININMKPLKTLSVAEVFEKVDCEVPMKKIEVKVPLEIVVADNSLMEEETQNSDGFGIIYPLEKPAEKEFKSEKKEHDSEGKEYFDEKYISTEELAANKINARDWKLLPIFKNYQCGVPSCRLYIKNLSKHVTLSDLNYIFKRYFINGIDEQGTMFDIRLMQEGRMKGQAFVTLQNIKQAELALKETNGYIIKNKPMVVQYARSSVTK